MEPNITQSQNIIPSQQPQNQIVQPLSQKISDQQLKQSDIKKSEQLNKQNRQEILIQSENIDDIQSLSQEIIKNQQEIPQGNPQNSAQISSKYQNIKNFNHNNNSNPLNNQKVTSCNCRKSKCLKMYCECFAKGNSCRDTCKCYGCQNIKNLLKQKKPDGRNDQEVQKSQDSNKKSVKYTKQRSCNCKKSFCLKKYCQCYNVGIPCNDNCRCEQCKNNGQNQQLKYDKGNAGSALANSNDFISAQQNFNGNDLKQSCQINNNTSLPAHINLINNHNLSLNSQKNQQSYISRRKQKMDEQEIQTKISQILKLVPQQNYQTMLDFLAYCLS